MPSSLSPSSATRNRPFFQRTAIRRSLFAAGILAALALIALLFTTFNLRRDLRASLPQLDGELPVAGLSASVTVTRDDHGVPAIHASSLDDLLFAQGFVTASDRLFQMDALRRHGAGELAELLGPSLIQHDRYERFLQLRATADRAVMLLPPDQLKQLQAYARGVNAFISSTQKPASAAQGLPVEFHLLHYQPAPWMPRDSLLISLVMAQDLATGFNSKLNREVLSARLPASLLPDLYPVGSWRDQPPTQTPTDLTAPTDTIEQIPLDRTQSRTRLPGSVRPGDLAAVSAALSAELCQGCRFGSNNWVVAASHSATGAPLLSNDMHLGLTAPDIWYEASLHIDPNAATSAEGAAPRLDVAGFTLPGVPFVVVGRNPYVAWGFTNSGADVQDLIVEHLRGSGNSTEFEHPDGSWSPVRHQLERIRVRAGHDVSLDILTTTHTIGDRTFPTPIVSPLYKSEQRSLALAWTVYDVATVNSPLYAVNTATDAASLVAAFGGFTTVSQNLVYADAHHIGYHLLGRIPVRGAATQHPRATQPFILPDNTPPEDEEDETGSLRMLPRPAAGAPHLAAAMLDLRHQAHPVQAAFSKNAHIPQREKPSAETSSLPSAPTVPYNIGSPISSVPIDALDAAQVWSGYIPYDALPSVLDPASGLIATANSRIVTDDYSYFITNNWVDAYRTERIHRLLQNRTGLVPADMLTVQTDVHSELDLLVAHRLAYALDHAALTKSDPRLRQAADLLRDFNGNMAPESAAAAVVAASRRPLWALLLAPQLREQPRTSGRPGKAGKLSTSEINDLLSLYTWDEQTTALEQLLQHTPARWLPRAYSSWNELLATAVQQGLEQANAPANLSTWTYGSLHPVEIPHPIFGSGGVISNILGVPTGTGLQPNGGDGTTIKQTGLHFGPSERFTADLSDPDATRANITTGESANPRSPWFLDQFQAWLHGTTFALPLSHPATIHTLVLRPSE